MASLPCRRPAARALPPKIKPHRVSPLSVEDIFQAVEMLADLEALAAEGMLIQYVDEYGVVRYCPQPSELQLKGFQ